MTEEKERSVFQQKINEIEHEMMDIHRKKRQLEITEEQLKKQKQNIQTDLEHYDIFHSYEYNACKSLPNFHFIAKDEFVQFITGLNAKSTIYEPNYLAIISSYAQILIDIKQFYPTWKFTRIEYVSTYTTYNIQYRFYFEDSNGFTFTHVV